MIFAGLLWGFGFVATAWALKAFTPAEILVYRFIVAVFVGEIMYFAAKGANFTTIREELFRAFPAGVLLATMLLLQTIGLKYTTATKSGFLTSLYVIIVPILNAWFFKSPSNWKNYVLVFVALAGTFVLMDASLAGINVGDLWTIGCSLIAAFHIIYIGKTSPHVGNAFRFNNFQSLWCLVVLTPLLFFQEKVTYQSPDNLAWIGIAVLGIASSVIAFYLQVRTQKILSDSTASMLFLLESPFAALFGYLLLSERLSPFQMTGAALIMVAAILQILWEPSSETTQTTPQSKLRRLDP